MKPRVLFISTICLGALFLSLSARAQLTETSSPTPTPAGIGKHKHMRSAPDSEPSPRRAGAESTPPVSPPPHPTASRHPNRKQPHRAEESISQETTFPRSAFDHHKQVNADGTTDETHGTVVTGGAHGPKTLGPFRDFQGTAPAPSPQGILISASEMFDGYEWVVLTDNIGMETPPSNEEDWRTTGGGSPVRGIGYVSSKDGNFEKGKVRITTIYGQDLDPADAGDLKMTGYKAGAPHVRFSKETIHGRSGKTYRADAPRLVAIADLPHVLGQGVDLKPFQGDPRSVVWVFSTELPANELGKRAERRR